MVKDNKFAAEPSADGTADAKVDQSEVKVTTTENVVKDNSKKNTTSTTKKSDLREQVYDDYIHGKSIAQIAEEQKLEAQEVLEMVEKTESER